MTLAGAELADTGPSLAGRGLLSGFYVNELLMRLVQRNDPHPSLFEAYRAALLGLVAADREEVALRVFEKRLLEAIGYALVLDAEPTTGRAVTPGQVYRYRLEHGPILQGEGVEMGVAVNGDTLVALAREELATPGVLREAKQLMRYVLQAYLGERPLRSRALFR